MANKKIKFLGITVYKRKTKGNKTKTYILGLPVWKKVSANNKKKYYLLGFRVWKRKFCSKIDDTGITISQSLTKKIYNSNCRILFNQNKILAHNNEKIRIHFLYIADSYWPSWESFYKSCIQDHRVDVKIVFLNTKDTILYTSQYEFSEKFLHDNNIPYIEYDDYFPEEEKPHVLVYQTPYNVNYEFFKKVKPDFITQQGIRVVYVSYGIEYDLSVSNNHIQNLHYGHMVHELSWLLFVMHKDIKDGFFKHCVRGGDHVYVSGHPKFDCYINQKFSLPKDLIKKARGRKIIAIQIHCYNDSDCKGCKRIHSVPFNEHKKILNTIKQYKDYFFVYTIHPAYRTRNIKKGFCSLDDYLSFVSEITTSENTYLYQGNHQSLLVNASAYITENSSLMIEMAFFNKSILYLYDVPISKKPFAEYIANTFHHGHTYKDVKEFLDNIVFKNDSLLELRKTYKANIFQDNVYNGKIGERMKEKILNKLTIESLYNIKE